MSFGSINGFHFQFDLNGTKQSALISYEALQDYFGGATQSPENAYKSNSATINAKAREILLRGEVRSPFLLTTRDFEASEQ